MIFLVSSIHGKICKPDLLYIISVRIITLVKKCVSINVMSLLIVSQIDIVKCRVCKSLCIVTINLLRMTEKRIKLR